MDTKRCQVLVVEDDAEMNSLERELLAAHGMDAVAAFDGEEALEACDRHEVHAVVLDVMLPRQDGFETCRRLRRKCGRGLPILIVTALEGEDCRRQGLESGADAYFTKPVDPDELVNEIRRLLEAA